MRNRTILLFLFVLCIGGLVLPGQQAIPGPGIAQQPSGQSASNRTISFSGTLDGQPDGALPIAFFIYSDRQSTAPLWSETQTIQITGGKYTAVLGSESPSGIPPELFTGDAAHWLGVEVNGREQRFLLVSVPYAMKAVDAERFGGLLPSQFVTAADLQAALRNAATGQAKQPPAHPGAGPAPLAAATGTPPQPATDFTDNNASEVLLVTQQGTGFAIHAISGGDAAIFAENSGLTGTAIRGSATATSGATTGVLGQAASPSGTAGAFESTNGAKIMSFRANGGEVGSIDQSGQIFAQNFAGPGFGLTNIPNSATTASSGNFPDAIVARDSFGSFSAGQIFAQNFAGPGFGLTNIPNSATTANSGNFPDAIVVRDSLGSFSAGQIFAQNFTGPGFGLTNIPNSATTATEQNLSGAIVARDIFGNFAAGQIFAQSFTGSGFGLTNIPNSATTAQSSNTPDTIVARGPSGEFAAGTVTASGVMTNLFLANIGTFDSSNAVSTLPVKSVLSINTPATCTQSRELLVKMDATPGQQLFICNSTGDGWLLVGDGTSAGVSSVTAGDSSISVGGAAFAPTISVADGGITAAKFAPNAVAGSIADGSLTPAKIAGTAATLGSNTFSGNQTVQGSVTSVSLSTGPVTSTSATVSGNSSGNLVSVSQSGTGAGLAVTSSGASFSPAINATSSQNSDAIDAHSVFGSAIFAVSTNGVGITSNGGGTGVQATGATAVLANSSPILPQSTAWLSQCRPVPAEGS